MERADEAPPMGALLSVLLGAGVEATGPQRLLEGLGFSAGFFVILSGAVLFTEANVTLPAALVRRDRLAICVGRQGLGRRGTG